MKSTFATLLIAITFVLGLNAQSLEGTTWSYTERVFGDSEIKTITTYFVFTTPTEVLWMFETPSNNIMPVAVGRYNSQSGRIVFPYNNITTPLRTEGNDVLFTIKVSGNRGEIVCDAVNEDYYWPERYYGSGKPCPIVKEKFHFTPNSELVGSWWKCDEIEDKPTDENTENYTFCFRSKYEVLINGGKYIYICMNDKVFVVTNSKIRGLVGRIAGDKNVMFCGMDGTHYPPEFYEGFFNYMLLSKI